MYQKNQEKSKVTCKSKSKQTLNNEVKGWPINSFNFNMAACPEVEVALVHLVLCRLLL